LGATYLELSFSDWKRLMLHTKKKSPTLPSAPEGIEAVMAKALSHVQAAVSLAGLLRRMQMTACASLFHGMRRRLLSEKIEEKYTRSSVKSVIQAISPPRRLRVQRGQATGTKKHFYTNQDENSSPGAISPIGKASASPTLSPSLTLSLSPSRHQNISTELVREQESPSKPAAPVDGLPLMYNL